MKATLADYLTQVRAAEHGTLRALAAAYGKPPLPLPEVEEIATLLDYFRLGLAIGQETKTDYELLDRLLSLERPGPEAQFVILGLAIGRVVEDPWEILEKVGDDDETGAA